MASLRATPTPIGHRLRDAGADSPEETSSRLVLNDAPVIDDLLTPEEFADRLKIGRSTVYEWINKGDLVAGRHFFRVGKVVRFLWPQAAIELMRSSATTAAAEMVEPSPVEACVATPIDRRVRNVASSTGRRGAAINLNY